MSMAKILRVGFVAAGLALVTGCPSTSSEGNIVTAISKVASGNMTDLTSTEVLILLDRIGEISPQVAGITITADEAEAAVDFLQANNIDTIADIEAIASNPDGLVVPDSVASLVESTSLPEAQAFR